MDPDANSITLNYVGGSMTTTVGLAKALFGENYNLLVTTPIPVTGTRKSTTRVDVIGGPTIPVKEGIRDYMQWPTSQANNAAAGKKVFLAFEGSEGQWTVRVTGPMASFADFLSESSPKPVVFRTSRGTKYGPFISTP